MLRLFGDGLTLKSGAEASFHRSSQLAVDDARLRRARMIAEARYGFRWHLAIYIIVNLGLVASGTTRAPDFPGLCSRSSSGASGSWVTTGARTIPPEGAGLRGRPRRFC